MKLGTFIAVVCLSLVAAPSALAVKLPLDHSLAAMSAIAPNSMLEDDLKSGWTVHPSAGYFSGSTTVDGSGATASAKGYGFTAQSLYSFGEHVGINFSGLEYNGKGDYAPGASEVGAVGGSAGANGWLIGSSLVIDPFSGDGFRMPFFFGLNYAHVASSTPTSPIITATTLDSPGYVFGFSVRFNIAFIRLEPFLVTTTPMNSGTVTCAAQVTSGTCGAASIQMLPITGINFVLRPLGWSFYFNASNLLVDSGISFYSIGKQFSF